MQPLNSNSPKPKPAPPPPVGKANRTLVRELISQSSRQKQQQNQAALLVDIETLKPNPDQPRRTTDPKQDEDLRDDIKIRGILEPIIVRPAPGVGADAFEIVAGERRFRAAQAAGLRVVPVIVQELSDKDVQLISLAENLQRAELSPLDEGRFFQKLSDQYNWSTYDIAKAINKSQGYVQSRFTLLRSSASDTDGDPETGSKPGASSGSAKANSEKNNKRVKNTYLYENSQLNKGLNRLTKLLHQTDETELAGLESQERLELLEKIVSLREQLHDFEKQLRQG